MQAAPKVLLQSINEQIALVWEMELNPMGKNINTDLTSKKKCFTHLQNLETPPFHTKSHVRLTIFTIPKCNRFFYFYFFRGGFT